MIEPFYLMLVGGLAYMLVVNLFILYFNNTQTELNTLHVLGAFLWPLFPIVVLVAALLADLYNGLERLFKEHIKPLKGGTDGNQNSSN